MVILHDKKEIESALRTNVFLHLFSIGDLDDFFWPYTIWYGAKEEGELQAIVLLYVGVSLPTLLALTGNVPPMSDLLRAIRHLLPRRFYAHLSPGLELPLAETFQMKPHGVHYKMALKNLLPLQEADDSRVVRLSHDDLYDIRALYDVAYPSNWFDARMLQTNHYFGIRERDQLVSIAGVHVYSPRYSVAALGNIATHPDYRGQGLAKAVTAKLCTSLLATVGHIGLNVKADNEAAIAVYQKLGFEKVASYGAYMLEPLSLDYQSGKKAG